jgi:hypothetical protein
MQRAVELCAAVVWGVCLLTALSGCPGGGGDDNGGGGGDGDRTQVTNNTREVIDRVLNIVLGDNGGVRGQTRATQANSRLQGKVDTRRQVTITIECNLGQVSFAGDVTTVDQGTVEDFTIAGTVTFGSCDGISGTLSLDSEGTMDSSRITLNVTLNGSINAGERVGIAASTNEGELTVIPVCTITFDDLSLDTTANRSGIITSPVIASGEIRATCDGRSITCTVNNVDIDNREAFEDSCQGSGRPDYVIAS